MTERPDPGPDWHRREVDDVVRAHDVDPDRGLHEEEVARRAALHGPNELAAASKRSPWRLFADQFRDFMTLVLVGAAVVSGLLGDVVDTLAITVIVLLNGIVGFVQAWRADQALAALKRLAAAQATVLRGGELRRVPAATLVPGDVVLLEAGNQVPADLRLTDAARLVVDESALTGESVGVEKHARALGPEAQALGDRLNMAFKGTTAARGRGRGVVVAIGMRTELGRVADLLETGDRETPLQRRLAAFGRRLAVVVLGICALIFAAGVWRGEPVVLMLMTAVSLAVAAIPEALPAVVTVLLALGARRMVALQALVRRLPSVETLGSVTVICSDKTGTLTQNRMTADEAWCEGPVWHAPEAVPADDGFRQLAIAAALCNDARRDAEGRWQGDPTETALTELADRVGVDGAELRERLPRLDERPFDSDLKRMTTLHRSGGGAVAYVKGAPESVLPLCTTGRAGDGFERDAVAARAQAMAARGLRVLAFARLDGLAGDLLPDERDLQCLGLVGLIDPPRPEAAAAVAECRAAGIVPVMITGDHPATALAIARRLGIADETADAVATGSELATLDDAALRDRLRHVRVFARVDPAQKIRLVQALQAEGHYVAMTGDGVNDAPALARADIGVSMGRGGTDVAREASSLVLLDDNFATIVGAVREGRRIYDNIRKFVRYAMTGNSGEIWTLFLAPLFGLPIPLLPVHILWVNLVTDGLPGLALAAEPAERGVMQRPPRPPRESLFAHGLWQHVLVVGLLIGVLCLAVQAWALRFAPALASSMVFTTLTLTQMAHVLAIRSERESLFALGLGSNRPLLGAVALTIALQMAVVYVPWLQPVFHTAALGGLELALCSAAAVIVWVAVELEKAWRRRAG